MSREDERVSISVVDAVREPELAVFGVERPGVCGFNCSCWADVLP